jgi:cation transport ATPase
MSFTMRSIRTTRVLFRFIMTNLLALLFSVVLVGASFGQEAMPQQAQAVAYNIVAIPVAAGLFVRWRLEIPMSVGAVAMNLSTIIVAVNAQLLRRLKLQREVGLNN